MNQTNQTPSIVQAGNVRFGNHLPLAIIAGPCAMESRAHALEMAAALKEIADRLGIGLVYKSSFDKANRTSGSSARGIGLAKAIEVFAEIKETFGLPVITDVHENDQCAAVAEVVDILQIPAFLCRQTDLLIAAAKTGRVVNVKKGQFLAPWDMANVAAKVTRRGKPQRDADRARRFVRLQHPCVGHALAADHGGDRRAGDLRRDSFGAAARRAGRHVGGQREFVPVLARAAVAVGVAGSVHRDASGPRQGALRWTQHGAAARTRKFAVASESFRRARQKLIGSVHDAAERQTRADAGRPCRRSC